VPPLFSISSSIWILSLSVIDSIDLRITFNDLSVIKFAICNYFVLSKNEIYRNGATDAKNINKIVANFAIRRGER
jgi:hypothetical protein